MKKKKKRRFEELKKNANDIGIDSLCIFGKKIICNMNKTEN